MLFVKLCLKLRNLFVNITLSFNRIRTMKKNSFNMELIETREQLLENIATMVDEEELEKYLLNKKMKITVDNAKSKFLMYYRKNIFKK